MPKKTYGREREEKERKRMRKKGDTMPGKHESWLAGKGEEGEKRSA